MSNKGFEADKVYVLAYRYGLKRTNTTAKTYRIAIKLSVFLDTCTTNMTDVVLMVGKSLA